MKKNRTRPLNRTKNRRARKRPQRRSFLRKSWKKKVKSRSLTTQKSWMEFSSL
ncbi:MAG: hypothetical protein KH183_04550 [Clostridium sp.]|nr:hypothetical protein [Clostridium sp.]MEE1497112.1 hypothetical protein [Clostridium sp.]